jgi:4-alpha-glucanotransferase
MTSSDILSRRSSGVLLHLTSLPGPHGSGDLGPEAFRFVDFLAAAGQRWWQMLPVGPIGGGNSPYQSPSSLAGNPLLISLEELAERGILRAGDLTPPRGLHAGRVNFPAVIAFRESRLRLAFARWDASLRAAERNRFERFCRDHRHWLEDHALFCTFKAACGQRPWTDWPAELRDRVPTTMRWIRRRLGREVRFHQFVQYQFRRQWDALRRHARELGIGLIGDIPIYVSHDSADVWAHREVFQLDRFGRPTAVGGVPPDHFARTGQLWGNPLYRWDVLKRRNYDWWVARFRANFELFDVARIDHFIGFHRYWSVPGRHKTAERGHWVPGPDADFFAAIIRQLGELPIIAEDVGAVTDGVIALRDRFNLPGLKILQYAFGRASADSSNLPHNFPRRCAVYTGTHDNDTTVGWYRSLLARARRRGGEKARRELEFIRRYLGTDGRAIHWDLIRAALASVADTALFPIQDLLGLDSRGRMNFPGTPNGNWEWRMNPGALTDAIAECLRGLVVTYGRGESTSFSTVKR